MSNKSVNDKKMAQAIFDFENELPKKTTDNNDDVFTDNELKLRPYCECKNCTFWSTSTNWTRFEDYIFTDSDCKKKTRKSTEKQTTKQLLFNENNCNDGFDCTIVQTLNHTQYWKDIKILLHGPLIPQRVTDVKTMKFHETIMNSLKKLDYHETRTVQSFIWPCIEQNLNCLLIDDNKTGKTLSYLLVIVSKILQNRQLEQYRLLQKHKGPICIILCSTIEECEDIYDLCKKFGILRNCRVYQLSNPFAEIKFDIDIMLTTPPILVDRLSKRAFTLKKLCYFIVENGSLIMDLYKKQLIILFNLINNVLEHRSVDQIIQLIITSTKWTNDLKLIVGKLTKLPIICIVNQLEAALYGGVEFNVNIMESHLKKQRLLEIIKDKWLDYRTIIFCEQNEIDILNLYLKLNNIETIVISDDLTLEIINDRELEWNDLTKNSYKVLICTDRLFNVSLKIDNVKLLIHYTFPETWKRFIKRFSSISYNLQSPIIKNKQKSDCTSYLFIDESCKLQLPKIFNLLTRLDGIPDKVINYINLFNRDQELKKLQNHQQLCPILKLLGDCRCDDCDYRHIINDQIDITNELPKNGRIKFEILKILNTTQFLIQIIDYIGLNDEHYNYKQDNIDKIQKIDDLICIKSMKINQICLYQTTINPPTLLLCKIVKIFNQKYVEVQIYENNQTIGCRIDNLYQIPDDFKVVEVVLANLIPQFNDINFSNQTYQLLKTRLNRFDNNQINKIIWTADIKLQLSQTLWIDNVQQILNVLKHDLVKLDLIKLIQELNLIDRNQQQLQKLRDLCHDSNIELPQYSRPICGNKQHVKQFKIEAFLDMNRTNFVYFVSGVNPQEFYVRLEKFNKLLVNLEKEITIDVNRGLLDLNRNETVKIGNYYTTREPDGITNRYTRVQILNIDNKHVLCYSVDYGDEFVCELNDLKKLPQKYREKLPFQAIQCCLQGIKPINDNWNDNKAIDLLYDDFMWINDNNDDNKYRTLYLKVCKYYETKDNYRTDYKYEVLLQDERDNGPILINQYLIDHNLAIDNGIEEYDIETIETIKTNDNNIENNDESDDQFELVTDNVDELLEMLISDGLRQKLLKLIDNKQEAIELPTVEKEKDEKKPTTFTIPIENDVETYLPEIYWSQTNELVRLKIKLIGVVNYSCRIIKKHLFVFKTNIDDRNYEVKFVLNNTAEIDKHLAKGQEVEVLLKKSCKNLEWLQLTGGKKRYRNIHYEFLDKDLDKYDNDGDKQKKILTLDISDSEDEENFDDKDAPMYVVESDLDSDYDYDIPDSSSED